MFTPSDSDGLSGTLEFWGVKVDIWIAEDGAPVVQIDTDDSAEPLSERVRVYLNDSRASRWTDDEAGRSCEGATLPLGDES